jgi:acetate CoA/acetoacetate CoA-transferase beta subunit
VSDIRTIIARRAAQELRDGLVINLGIGIPGLVADYVPEGADVVIHTQNGAIGVGPAPQAFCADPDRANASGRPITLRSGGSYFDTGTSFAMIRGGHVDMCFLGTLQVDGEGNIASYEIPGKTVAGMGGAMDLLAGAKIVNVCTEHCSKDGSPKLVKKCMYPLTGAGEADVIITERALFRRYPGKGFVLEEVAYGYNLDDIAECTEMDYAVSDTVRMEAYGSEGDG